MEKIDKNILKKIYKKRIGEYHKYDAGLLIVIGGGQFYTGSPALAAFAAFRAGVDMVRILAPKRAADIIASISPNLAAYPLKGNWLDEEDLQTLISMSESAKIVSGGKTAVVIGGGVGRSEGTKQTLLNYLKKIEIKAVIDADGIYTIAKDIESIRGKNFIITPHLYEFYVLTKREVINLPLEKRIEAVREEAEKLGCVILLKGATDIISNGKETAINESGSPYMSVGGTGDTLAGIAAALLARGVNPFLSAKAAAFINGKAGEIAAKKLKASMTATDLIDYIPNVLSKVFR